MVRAWTWILTLLVLAGCSRPLNREQLAKEVVKGDPDFAWVLDKAQALSNRIATYERELALKRSTVERNIAQLRKDLVTATSNVKGKVAEVKRQMEPERRRLQLELSMANEELYAKRFQRASLGRSIAQLRKAEKTVQAAGTEQARARRQNAQLDELQRDAHRLDQEIAVIKGHLRLLKIKILLIRL
ncbi:MAG: hypothetical protein HYY90_01115 [Candidatus Omnitrophica bacterium]|nr:hypothetical protein [Candidatus Omnitrophota bacterium]